MFRFLVKEALLPSIDEGERRKTLVVRMSTAKPDYAVTAHGRARLEVTEMKAPATFTPVLIKLSKKTNF